MISPSIGYLSTTNPITSRPSAGLQTSGTLSAARGVTPPPADSGLYRQADTTQALGGLPRPTIALLESLQAGMQTSALLSSLVSQPESGFSSTSPLGLMLKGQSSPLRPTAALLESLQAGRQSSALFSSLSSTGPAPGPLGPLPSLATRVNAAFGDAQAEQTLAEQIISANATRQPSAEGNQSALTAYIQELQAQLGSGPQSLSSAWPREWFA